MPTCCIFKCEVFSNLVDLFKLFLVFLSIFVFTFHSLIISTMAITITISFSLLLLDSIQLCNNLIHPSNNFILFFADNFHLDNNPIRIVIIFPYRHDHLLYSLINLLQFPHQSQILFNQLISIYFLLYQHILYFILYLLLRMMYMWIPDLP